MGEKATKGLWEWLGEDATTELELSAIEIRFQALRKVVGRALFKDRVCPPALIVFHRGAVTYDDTDAALCLAEACQITDPS